MNQTTPATTAQRAKMLRRIGSTTYEVSAYFSETGKETMSDKIIRLIRNEVEIKRAVVK